jgi:glycosyltransferase involved in cell wall biosynthesis
MTFEKPLFNPNSNEHKAQKNSDSVEPVMIAIVVVAYNRSDSVSRLLSSLLKANYSQSATLIISVDKSNTDVVERLADNFVWPFGDKIVVKHSENLGLRKHILSIGEYTKQYDGVIVLEDDLEVSPSFYNFALEAVAKYQNDDRIAGISLFAFPINMQISLPFIPERNEYDAFLFQNAMSWGQIWMKDAWEKFIEWYEKNSEEFSEEPHLPSIICHWGKNSWLKYHIKYCIEQDKYFVYPYTSLTYCSGAVGMHSKEVDNYTQGTILRGNKIGFRLPDFSSAVKYDSFYERVGMEYNLGIDDVCIDLNGCKGNRMKHRYWLTTRREPYKVIKSFGMMYLPMEQNVACAVEGDAIFLYDTYEKGGKPKNNFLSIINYYKLNGLFSFMLLRGFAGSSVQLLRYVMHKFLRRI